MIPPTLCCALALRDGGIDALAALDGSLSDAIVRLPPESEEELRLLFGRIMSDIVYEIINPAIRAFPELNPDEATWQAVVRSRAASRSAT